MNELPAPFHKQMGGFPDGMKVDRWQITHYGPPCFVKLDVGSAPVGTGARQGERGKGVNMWNLNAITPETEKSAHYFFAQAYNFKLGERWIADMLAKQIRDIFLEDMAMVKAQQQNMDLGPSPVTNLGQDKAWVAMRGIVQRLINEEQQAGAGRSRQPDQERADVRLWLLPFHSAVGLTLRRRGRIQAHRSRIQRRRTAASHAWCS